MANRQPSSEFEAGAAVTDLGLAKTGEASVSADSINGCAIAAAALAPTS